jgi:hypothetical protein
MPDPSRVEGPEHRVQQAFFDVMDALNEKLFKLRLSRV